jgi:hypothetical protein
MGVRLGGIGGSTASTQRASRTRISQTLSNILRNAPGCQWSPRLLKHHHQLDLQLIGPGDQFLFSRLIRGILRSLAKRDDLLEQLHLQGFIAGNCQGIFRLLLFLLGAAFLPFPNTCFCQQIKDSHSV